MMDVSPWLTLVGPADRGFVVPDRQQIVASPHEIIRPKRNWTLRFRSIVLLQT